MPDLTGLLQGITYTGIGAIVSPLVVAMIQARSKKSESRETAADLISNAAGALTQRLSDDNIELRETIKHQRRAILAIVDVLDDLIDSVDLPDDQREKARAASRLAREAI